MLFIIACRRLRGNARLRVSKRMVRSNTTPLLRLSGAVSSEILNAECPKRCLKHGYYIVVTLSICSVSLQPAVKQLQRAHCIT